MYTVKYLQKQQQFCMSYLLLRNGSWLASVVVTKIGCQLLVVPTEHCKQPLSVRSLTWTLSSVIKVRRFIQKRVEMKFFLLTVSVWLCLGHILTVAAGIILSYCIAYLISIKYQKFNLTKKNC